MSAELKTIETEVGEVTYDSDMPIGVLEDLSSASTLGNLEALRTAFAAFVVAWPFEGSPADPEAWKALRRSEFAGLLTAISSALAEEGN